MVSSEQIKRKFLNYTTGINRKKRCGCIETRIVMMGSASWIQDIDLLCKKHRDEFIKEFKTQTSNRVLAESSKKNKRKVKSKKDDDVETKS
jgi:hypothetical protein